MRPDDLREYLEQRPFHPFRIHLSSGAFFDIRQPQAAHVGRSVLVIAMPLEGAMQRFAVAALVYRLDRGPRTGSLNSDAI